MKIYYREDVSFEGKATIKITEDKRLIIHVYDKDGSLIGKHGQPLEGHTSYLVLFSRNESGFFVRDKANKVNNYRIKIISANQITLGSRMKYDEVSNRYNAYAIMQLDTNTVSLDVTELQMYLYGIKKDKADITCEIPGQTFEYLLFPEAEIWAKGSKRHTFWDTYEVIIDGNHYRYPEFVKETTGFASVNMNGREYLDIEIQKYSNGFAKKLTRDADNETLAIECLSGISNTQRVALKNGHGKFRWYPMGYEGIAKIKIGWRWYSGIVDFRMAVTND